MKKSWKLFTSVFVVHMLFLFVTTSFTTGCSQQEKPASNVSSQSAPVRASAVKATVKSQPAVASPDEDRTPVRNVSQTPKRTNLSSGESSAAPPRRLPRMVDLGADRCMPCRMMAPILSDLKAEFNGKVEVDFIDVWKDPSPGREYRIRVIPTQVFFDEHGKELFRHEGYYSRAEILAKWRELGFIEE